MNVTPHAPAVRELAARIYTQLLSQASAGGAAAIDGAPELARLSFRLAEAFHAVEDGFNAANSQKGSDFKLEADNIAEWSKK